MTTNADSIVLPAHLHPSDGRFGSGPSKVRPEAVSALAVRATDYLGTSHRQATVRDVVRRARDGLAEMFSLPDGYEVLLGNGGSTAFWDAASFGLVERKSQHVVIGEFSSKCAGVMKSAPHLEDPDVIETAPGEVPRPNSADPSIDSYCFPHNETSTGVMCNVVRPSGANGLVMVDATSGAGGLRVDPSQFDVYYFAPQKCFAGDGGLWLALVSPAAVERIERIHATKRWIPASLDLATALEQSRLNQTYNTPALATVFMLAHQAEWMNANGGLEWCARRCDESAAIIYRWADEHKLAHPFVAQSARSHVTATIDFDDSVDALAVARVLRRNGILDVDSYRKLGRNQLRVAMFPAIEPNDIKILTEAIDFILEELL